MIELDYMVYDFSGDYKNIIEKRGSLLDLFIEVKIIEHSLFEATVPDLNDINGILRDGFYHRGGAWQPFELNFDEYEELLLELSISPESTMLRTIGRPCNNCNSVHRGFHFQGYNTFRDLRELVKENRIEFLAGSCPLDEIELHLEREDLYTIEHYFRCKCGLIYYTGYCVRGAPIVKVLNELPDNINITISGKYGSYFS